MPKKLFAFWSQFSESLMRLGMRRLIALGLLGIALLAAILASSFYLTRPAYETLYVGLSRDDVNRMGAALGEVGVPFDVTSDGTSIRVAVGEAEHARMFLAEKGLPNSNNAGYELFDHMGSLGLTSFMQEVTRQRALEGEIARTIQAVRGVKAARVHIVLPDKGSFRRAQQKPTAAVIIRTEANFLAASATAIRHLVAAAVPALEPGSVTVTDTNGVLLVSGMDAVNDGSMRMASLETQVADKITDNIRKQLAPYLGLDHFQSSVQVMLDTDRRQISETIYDPESQVVRSTRAIRDQGNSTNSRNSDAVGVEQNIPREEIASNGGESSSDQKDRREETTNFEISSKVVSTVSEGYRLQRLAISVVVDKAKLARTLHDIADDKKEEALKERLTLIHQMVASAVGLDVARGDVLNISAVEFLGQDLITPEADTRTLWVKLLPYMPSFVAGLALVIAILLVILLGIRPLMREMREYGAANNDNEGSLPELSSQAASEHQFNDAERTKELAALEALRGRMRGAPEERLEHMVSLDEERFANILKDWVRSGSSRTT